MKPSLYVLILCLLLPFGSNAQHRVNKRMVPLDKRRKLKYEYIGRQANSLMPVRDFAGKYGYVDNSFKEVVPRVYDKAWFFCNGLGLVEKDGKKGIVDTMGRTLLPCIYDKIESPWLHNYSWGVPVTCYIDSYAIVTTDTSVLIYDVHKQNLVDMRNAKIWGDFYDNRYYKVSRDGLLGISLDNGQEVLPTIYDYIGSCKDGRTKGVKGQKWGYWDANYKEAIPFEYDAASDFSEGLAAVLKGRKWGYINRQGKVVADFCFEKGGDYHNHVAKVRDNNKYGLINTNGALVLACIYDEIGVERSMSNRSRPDIFTVQQNKKWAFVDNSGRLLTQFRYDLVNSYYTSVYLVKENGLYGFINSNFIDSTPVVYSKVEHDYRHACFVVCKAGKWGAIDTEYREIIPFKYNSPQVIADSLGKNDNRESSYNQDTMTAGYRSVSEFVNKLAIVGNAAGRFGYINKKGQEVIPCVYTKARPFVHGCAPVCKDGKWGLIDKRGRCLMLQENGTLRSDRGFIGVEQGNKYGIVDRKGREIVPCIYDNVACYSRKLFFVRKDTLCGFADRKGAMKIPFLYSEVSLGKVLCVKQGGRYKILNRKGKTVRQLDTAYKFVGVCSNGRMCVQDTSNKFGYINKRGRLVVPCVYNCRGDFSEGGAIVKKYVLQKNGDMNSLSEDSTSVERCGVINRRGKEIIPIQYEDIIAYSKRRLIPIKKEEYWGSLAYINNRNKMVIPYMQNSLSHEIWISDGVWSCMHNDIKWLFINKRGKVKLELKYAPL